MPTSLGPPGRTCAAIALLSTGLGCPGDQDRPSQREGVGVEDARQGQQFLFVDVATEAGLTRVVHAGRPDKDHLLDSAGTGCAWLDYDLDGFLDAYIVNGWKVSAGRIVERGSNALYRNLGDGTFVDATAEAGVTGEGHWGSGVAVADYDDDGWPDILVTNFGPNVLYHNRGDGTFENVAEAAGIEAPSWNTGASFFDADGDGDLDLYIATYIEASLEEFLQARPTLDWKGVDKVAFGPFGLSGAPDRFFLAADDGTFTEATKKAGLSDRALGYGFGVRTADFDDDGDQDLYVANDSDANYLYRNDGTGRFTEIGLWSGAALDANGAAQAGMGVAVGDVNTDSFLDIVVTNFSEDFSTLYVGEGRGFFKDVSDEAGVGPATFLALSWGTVLADLDNDGDQDLVIANGHIYPQVDRHPEFGMTYDQANQLFENLGSGMFVEATERAGSGFASVLSSRGVAAGDYDNDGDLDLLITNLDQPPTLLRNDSTGGSWLIVICKVAPGEGPLIGTQVRVEIGDRTLLRDIASSSSYLSVHDPRLHFGLGEHDIVDRLEVRWPDGRVDVMEAVAANRFLEIEKGATRRP